MNKPLAKHSTCRVFGLLEEVSCEAELPLALQRLKNEVQMLADGIGLGIFLLAAAYVQLYKACLHLVYTPHDSI